MEVPALLLASLLLRVIEHWEGSNSFAVQGQGNGRGLTGVVSRFRAQNNPGSARSKQVLPPILVACNSMRRHVVACSGTACSRPLPKRREVAARSLSTFCVCATGLPSYELLCFLIFRLNHGPRGPQSWLRLLGTFEHFWAISTVSCPVCRQNTCVFSRQNGPR